jgi:hypothetical protein
MVTWKGGWSGNGGNPETSIMTYYTGDVVLYDSWGKNADVNEDAYNIAANKLNLVYVD